MSLPSQPESFQQAWRSGVPFEVSGVVSVIYADDFQNHRAEVIHTIRDERTGHEFRLRFEREAPALQSRSPSEVAWPDERV